MLSRVSFVHRTAYDFLTGSDEGEKILSYDPTSPKERYLRLAKGELASSSFRHGVGFIQGLEMLPNWHRIFWEALAHALSQGLEEEEVTRVLSDSHELWCAGRFPGSRPILTSSMVEGLGQFALSVIRRDPSPKNLATRVLKTLFETATEMPGPSAYGDLIWDGYIVQSLISIGASPISLDRGLSDGLEQLARGVDQRTTTTTFALAVILILQGREIQSRDRLESYVQCFKHFRKYRADGEERVLVGIYVNDVSVKLNRKFSFPNSWEVAFRFEVPLAYLIELVVGHLTREGSDAEPFMGPGGPIPCDIPGRLRIQRFLVKGYRGAFHMNFGITPRLPSKSAMEMLSCIHYRAILWLEADNCRRPKLEEELRTMTRDLLKQFQATQSTNTSISQMARDIYLAENSMREAAEAAEATDAVDLPLEWPHHSDFTCTACSDRTEGSVSAQITFASVESGSGADTNTIKSGKDHTPIVPVASMTDFNLTPFSKRATIDL